MSHHGVRYVFNGTEIGVFAWDESIRLNDIVETAEANASWGHGEPPTVAQVREWAAKVAPDYERRELGKGER